MSNSNSKIPASAGIGLRGDHYAVIDAEHPDVAFLEVHTENYFGAGGVPHHYLSKLRDHYPVSFHGVGLSIGSVDPLEDKHLKRISQLVDRYEPGLVSEHLSWGSVNGVYANDLLPYPYTQESLTHFANRVETVQETLQRQILIENLSTYVGFSSQDFSEPEFLNELCKRSGCGLLLDVNNVYVCATNHDTDAFEYLEEIDLSLVGEIHLAGHTVKRFDDGEFLIDTHNALVCAEVWELFSHTVERCGTRPVLIEWDTELPELQTLVDESIRANKIMEQADAVAA